MTNRRLFGLGALSAGLLGSSPAFAKARSGSQSSGLDISARSPFVIFEGRTADMLDASGAPFVRASFPGIVLRSNFKASKLILKTSASSETVFLDIRIDGAAPKMVHLAPGQQDLVVFDGELGIHKVEVARRTESWEGQWDILGLSLDQGQFLPAPELPAKKLMFIGDSITCGAGCDVAKMTNVRI